MTISKKLQVTTQSQILDEVAKELKLNRKDVERTYSIWIEYLTHIANDTEQATITLPHLGKMYVSMVKMKQGLHSERLKKFKEIKLREIEKIDDNCKYNAHRLTVPILLKYGLSKKNVIPFLIGKSKTTEYYSINDIVNNQTEIFFKEDIEFSDNKKLEEKFKRDNEQQDSEDN